MMALEDGPTAETDGSRKFCNSLDNQFDSEGGKKVSSFKKHTNGAFECLSPNFKPPSHPRLLPASITATPGLLTPTEPFSPLLTTINRATSVLMQGFKDSKHGTKYCGLFHVGMMMSTNAISEPSLNFRSVYTFRTFVHVLLQSFCYGDRSILPLPRSNPINDRAFEMCPYKPCILLHEPWRRIERLLRMRLTT